MKQFLVVVDMQKDFVDGALGTPEAVAIVPKVAEKIDNFYGIFLLRTTHTLMTICRPMRASIFLCPTASRALWAGIWT